MILSSHLLSFILLCAIGPMLLETIMDLLYIDILINFLHSTDIYKIPPYTLIYMVCTITQEIILSPLQRWRNSLKYKECQPPAVVKELADGESRIQTQFLWV